MTTVPIVRIYTGSYWYASEGLSDLYFSFIIIVEVLHIEIYIFYVYIEKHRSICMIVKV